MINVTKYYGIVHLFMVHDVDLSKVAENELNKFLDNCHGPLESGDSDHVSDFPKVLKEENKDDHHNGEFKRQIVTRNEREV